VKNLLEVSRYRLEDKIKIENERIESGGDVELIDLAQAGPAFGWGERGPCP
jgi:hypothetical protein